MKLGYFQIGASVALVALVPACVADVPGTDRETTATTVPQAPPVKEGEVHTAIVPTAYGESKVTFEVRNGRAILEDDIDLGDAQEILNANAERGSALAGRAKTTAYWDDALIPYSISSSFSAAQRDEILAAIQHWQEKTPVRFVPRTSEDDYVKFETDKEVCESPIGKRGGEQVIKLAVDCHKGQIIHEIAHSAGFYHEQSRADRDAYVTINWSNIVEDKKHNFETYIERGDDGQELGPYDFGSVMHYGSDFFAKKQTVVGAPPLSSMVKKDGSVITANREKLSDADIAGIKKVYAREFALAGWAHSQGGWEDSHKWVAGDFDGDGRVDLATAWNDGGYISIDLHKNTGSGFVYQAWARRQGGWQDSHAFIAGDFDRDGRLDIATAFNDWSAISIDVHRNTGSGAFELRRWVTRQGGWADTHKFLAADFDRDGNLDIATVFDDGGGISIDLHRNTGSTFTLARWSTRQGSFWDAQQWMVGDFDKDGWPDLADAFGWGGVAAVDVHRNYGSGFSIRRWATGLGDWRDEQKWVAADFDGDGRIDVAKAWNDEDKISIDVHANTGTTFGFERWATRQGGWQDVQKWFAADFDNDGRVDMANAWKEWGYNSIDVHVSTRPFVFVFIPPRFPWLF